jgi:hypothetical protein
MSLAWSVSIIASSLRAEKIRGCPGAEGVGGRRELGTGGLRWSAARPVTELGPGQLVKYG